MHNYYKTENIMIDSNMDTLLVWMQHTFVHSQIEHVINYYKKGTYGKEEGQTEGIADNLTSHFQLSATSEQYVQKEPFNMQRELYQHFADPAAG